MKWYKWMLVFLAGCVAISYAVPTEEDIEKLENKIKIVSVNDDTTEEDDVEYEELSFSTYQDEDSAEEYTFFMRVTVELTEKKTKKVFYAQASGTQSAVDSEYNGEDNWKFAVANSELEKPKVTAYVIEYGIVFDNDDGKPEFEKVAVETDDVDTLKELTGRGEKMEEKARLMHQYNFLDSEDEVQQSSWKQISK